jgi:hypothetical protein
MPTETYSSLARWKALVQYRSDAGLINVDMGPMLALCDASQQLKLRPPS